MTTYCFLIECAVNCDWYLVHLDAKTAYLYAPIDYDVFFHLPGYEGKGKMMKRCFVI